MHMYLLDEEAESAHQAAGKPHARSLSHHQKSMINSLSSHTYFLVERVQEWLLVPEDLQNLESLQNTTK